MKLRVVPLALLCCLLAYASGIGQERRQKSSDANQPKTNRAHYVVRHADPVVLAEVVGTHFNREAHLVAVPAGSGNSILISGSPGTVDEVVKLLEQLDRKPQTVEVEITVVELPFKQDGVDVKVDPSTIETLVKSGQGNRIKLTVVEGQQITSTSGGNKPYVAASTIMGGGGFGGKGGGPGGGGVARSIAYQPTGTTLKMTARVGTDDVISLDLHVQDSKIRATEANEELTAPAFDKGDLSTKLRIPSGKSVVAQSVRSSGKSGNLSVILVTARVVEPGATMAPLPKTK